MSKKMNKQKCGLKDKKLLKVINYCKSNKLKILLNIWLLLSY